MDSIHSSPSASGMPGRPEGTGFSGNRPGRSAAPRLEAPDYSLSWPLSTESITAGRGLSNRIILTGAGISRNHFVIEHTSNGWTITDLSANGTYLKGNKLYKNTPFLLTDGDIISVKGGSIANAPQNSSAQGMVRWVVHLPKASSTAMPSLVPRIYLDTTWLPLKTSDIRQQGPSALISLSKLMEQNGMYLDQSVVTLYLVQNGWKLADLDLHSRQQNLLEPALADGAMIKLHSGIKINAGSRAEPEILAALGRINQAMQRYASSKGKPDETEAYQQLLIAMGRHNFYQPLYPLSVSPDLPSVKLPGGMIQGPSLNQNPTLFKVMMESSDKEKLPLFTEPNLLRHILPQASVLVLSGREVVSLIQKEKITCVLNPLSALPVELSAPEKDTVRPSEDGTETEDSHQSGGHSSNLDADAEETVNLDEAFFRQSALNMVAHSSIAKSKGELAFNDSFDFVVQGEDASFIGFFKKFNELFTFYMEYSPSRFSIKGHPDAGALSDQLMSLRHPHLLPVAMRFGDGMSTMYAQKKLNLPTLKGYIDTYGALEEKEIFTILLQVVDLIEYLNARNPAVVLTSLDPSLFLLTPDGQVLYRGLCRTGSMVQAWTKQTKFTPYLASETYTGEAGFPSTIYSLGMLALYLISADNPQKLLGSLGPNINFTKAGIPVHDEFAHLIRKCIRVSADARYQNIKEFLEDLDLCKKEFGV